jgi:hypothetical protein
MKDVPDSGISMSIPTSIPSRTDNNENSKDDIVERRRVTTQQHQQEFWTQLGQERMQEERIQLREESEPPLLTRHDRQRARRTA